MANWFSHTELIRHRSRRRWIPPRALRARATIANRPRGPAGRTGPAPPSRVRRTSPPSRAQLRAPSCAQLRAAQLLVTPVCQDPRCPAAAYSSTAAAALTLSDSIRPRSGIATSASHAAATRGRRPRPSDPSTSTTDPA